MSNKSSFPMNQKNMIEYYEKFDPIEKKYKNHFGSNFSDHYKECFKYENNRLLSDLTKKEFGDIYANLKLVYENEELTDEIIKIYDLVYDKVINQYLNIDGMERLFSENYINFEWEMHLGIDYAGHSMKFYRDHFIHQVRDAYCMDLLLENGYAKQIKETLGNEGSSKISRYVCKHISLQMEREDKLLGNDAEKRRTFYLENIVYMSSYMSALFHDIGYPEVANMQSGRNILAYIANVYNFGSGHIDFDRIITALQNSLLFRVVSPKEIRKRVESEKIDHGAVSALMFLLHFYENGAVYGLEPYKKCAVEIAGLAIYNHTNSYAYVSEKNTQDALYEKNVFVLNPISYLLRICDDLQEWDRIYFEISSNANIIFCNKCYTPIVRRTWDERNDVYYLCNCNKKRDKHNSMETSGVFGTVFQRGSFPYRRLYNVTVCTDLLFKTANKGKHVFELNYDLERLLYVAYINPSYAKYRINELNQLKKMFVRQATKEMTYLEYFMTANILLIKAKIVEKYLKHSNEKVQLTSFAKNVLKRTKESGLSNDMLHGQLKQKSTEIYNQTFTKLIKDKFPNEVERYLDENFYIYIYLCLVMETGMYANKFNVQNHDMCDVLENLWKNFNDNKHKDTRYTEDALLLMKDCCKQATRLYSGITNYNYYPDKYFEQYKTDKGIEASFYRFAHSDNYQPLAQRNFADMNQLDAYTDLYLFKIILNEIRD